MKLKCVQTSAHQHHAVLQLSWVLLCSPVFGRVHAWWHHLLCRLPCTHLSCSWCWLPLHLGLCTSPYCVCIALHQSTLVNASVGNQTP